MEQGLALMANMDASVLYRVRSFPQGLELPVWLVVQNTLISEWARKGAKIEVQGPEGFRILHQFTWSGGDRDSEKPMTSFELFEYLVQTYSSELTPPTTISTTVSTGSDPTLSDAGKARLKYLTEQINVST